MSQSFGVYPALSMWAAWMPPNRRWPMLLNALVEKLKRRAKDDFKGRHFEAALILQAVSWYLRYPLSYRDIEELFLERGLEVDHATLNRWVLVYAPLIERDFNVNVSTGTNGMIIGGSGGHSDTAAGAKLALVTTQLAGGRYPKIVDQGHNPDDARRDDRRCGHGAGCCGQPPPGRPTRAPGCGRPTCGPD